MTIIATYRIDDMAIYVNDFRVTINNQEQFDASFKFIDIGNQLGMFLAGDVTVWLRLVPLLNHIMDQVNVDNILDFKGPFKETIQREVEELPSDVYSRAGALGFITDDTCTSAFGLSL